MHKLVLDKQAQLEPATVVHPLSTLRFVTIRPGVHCLTWLVVSSGSENNSSDTSYLRNPPITRLPVEIDIT